MSKAILSAALATVQGSLWDRYEQTHGLPEMCSVYNRLRLIGAFGGGDNLRLAAVLMHMPRFGMSVEAIGAAYGEPVAKLVAGVQDGPLDNWESRKHDILLRLEIRCPAYALLVLVDAIDQITTILYDCPHLNAGEARWQAYWATKEGGCQDYLWFGKAVEIAVVKNQRVAQGAEYPELKTQRAKHELHAAVQNLATICHSR
jgi:hypothetical protein